MHSVLIQIVTHVGQQESNIKLYITSVTVVNSRIYISYIREVNKQYGTNSLHLKSHNVDYKRQHSGSGTRHAWDLVRLRETAPSLDL
jgi:hypothetical protein